MDWFGERQERDHLVGSSLVGSIQALVEEGLERSGLYVYIIDREFRFRYISTSAAHSLGRDPEDILGRTPEELSIPQAVFEDIKVVVNESLSSRKTLRGTLEAHVKGTEHFEYDVTPIFDGGAEPSVVLAVVFDRTTQVLERKILEAIARINDLVRSSLDCDELVRQTIAAVTGSLNDDALALAIHNDGQWTAHHSVALDPEDEKELSGEAISIASHFMDADGPEVINDAAQDPRINPKVRAKYGGRTLLVMPVRISPVATVVLIFVRMEVWPYTQQEIDLREKIASSVSVAIKDQLMIQDLSAKSRERDEMLIYLAGESERLNKILDATPVAIAMFEKDEQDFRLILSNNIFRNRVLRSATRPLEGKYLAELVIPEELERGRALIRDAFASGRTLVSQDYEHDTGEFTFPTQIMITPLSREPDSFLMAAVNISELTNARKELEGYAAKVEAERARLRAMIDNLPVGVVLVDAAGKLLEANAKGLEMGGGRSGHGSKKDAVTIRAKWSNTGMPVLKDSWPIVRALKTGEHVKGDMVDIVGPDGRHGTELLSAVPIKDSKGKRIGAVGIVQDVTEHRHLEHEALEAKERAEIYLDLVTHDIQGYNAAISGYIQLAMAKDKLGKKKDDLQKALESLKASTDLIDTMRKVQMVEMDDVAHGHVELSSMIDEVISDVQIVGGDRVHIEKVTVPDSYALASSMIREVFWNILINSVKHSEGEVHIGLRQNRSYDGGREYHKFIIEDDGPGIPDDIKPKVFLRKYRGRTKAQGSGLGLYLTKRLVEDNGGRIWLEDRVPGDHSRGVRFIVHLPATTFPVDNIKQGDGRR